MWINRPCIQAKLSLKNYLLDVLKTTMCMLSGSFVFFLVFPHLASSQPARIHSMFPCIEWHMGDIISVLFPRWLPLSRPLKQHHPPKLIHHIAVLSDLTFNIHQHNHTDLSCLWYGYSNWSLLHILYWWERYLSGRKYFSDDSGLPCYSPARPYLVHALSGKQEAMQHFSPWVTEIEHGRAHRVIGEVTLY